MWETKEEFGKGTRNHGNKRNYLLKHVHCTTYMRTHTQQRKEMCWSPRFHQHKIAIMKTMMSSSIIKNALPLLRADPCCP
jgi:hypothetical protein